MVLTGNWESGFDSGEGAFISAQRMSVWRKSTYESSRYHHDRDDEYYYNYFSEYSESRRLIKRRHGDKSDKNTRSLKKQRMRSPMRNRSKEVSRCLSKKKFNSDVERSWKQIMSSFEYEDITDTDESSDDEDDEKLPRKTDGLIKTLLMKVAEKYTDDSNKNESVKAFKKPDEENLERSPSKKIIHEKLENVECEYSRGNAYSGDLYFCEHCCISTISL